ncbi:MAG: hypothetical protein CSA24_02445 [Deltaproteobacteria bacterium]|nr:MAG: hypothetical protein CSA24_02445 [Deltaproteobacteria bacterium]
MTNTPHNEIETLESLRLPELQARFEEVVGESTRCPNRTFLMRRIVETLESGEAQSPTEEEAQTAETQPEEEARLLETTTNDSPRPKLTKLSVSELRALYVEVLGRETSSFNKRYLKWKIREAQLGRVPVGPRGGRRSDGPVPEHRVLPLRMEAEQVERLDEARERLGLKSRMDLFRRALHAYLQTAGEVDVAALFAPEA